MNKWFFIASPKTHGATWEDLLGWGKHNGHNYWSIPDRSIDMDKLDRVKEGDIILRYNATPQRQIIGYCKCEGTYEDGPYEGFSHGVYIDNFKKYSEPIKLSELREEGFDFITDFLGNNNGRGRSIVQVSEEDWEKYEGFRKSRGLKSEPVNINKSSVTLKRHYES
ncbi:MAG TPA: EVE domain-containing protein [Candidatus Methanoperedens sp.]